MTATQLSSTPEMRARAAEIHKKLAHKPPIEEILTPQELADGSFFYLELRRCVFQLRRGREAAGLSVPDLAEKIGVPADKVAWLEEGHTNPTWKLLGDYAHAVGLTLNITATPAA